MQAIDVLEAPAFLGIFQKDDFKAEKARRPAFHSPAVTCAVYAVSSPPPRHPPAQQAAPDGSRASRTPSGQNAESLTGTMSS